MGSNFHESILKASLKSEFSSRCLTDIGDCAPFFAALSEKFPKKDSKIDWSKVPGAVTRFEDDQARQIDEFLAFFDEVALDLQAEQEVIYIGDSLTDFAIAGRLDCLRCALPKVLEVPQHHYVCSRNADWCMCFTTEGDMAFGFSHSTVK